MTAGTYYTITETDYDEDGYATSYVIDSNGRVDGTATGSQQMGTDSHEVVFTNHKEGIVPTGILIETGPYILMGAVVIIGLVALLATSRRRSRK